MDYIFQGFLNKNQVFEKIKIPPISLNELGLSSGTKILKMASTNLILIIMKARVDP